VACSVLEATVDYPFRFGTALGNKARKWATVWGDRVEEGRPTYGRPRGVKRQTGKRLAKA